MPGPVPRGMARNPSRPSVPRLSNDGSERETANSGARSPVQLLPKPLGPINRDPLVNRRRRPPAPRPGLPIRGVVWVHLRQSRPVHCLGSDDRCLARVAIGSQDGVVALVSHPTWASQTQTVVPRLSFPGVKAPRGRHQDAHHDHCGQRHALHHRRHSRRPRGRSSRAPPDQDPPQSHHGRDRSQEAALPRTAANPFHRYCQSSPSSRISTCLLRRSGSRSITSLTIKAISSSVAKQSGRIELMNLNSMPTRLASIRR